MYLGTIPTLLWGLSVLLQRNDLHAQVKTNLVSNGTYTATKLHDTYVAVIDGAVMFAVIGCCLWLLMAILNARGRRRARLGATICTVLGVLLFFTNLSQVHTALGVVLLGIACATGIGTVMLMWRPESEEFYTARSGPGRARNRRPMR